MSERDFLLRRPQWVFDGPAPVFRETNSSRPPPAELPAPPPPPVVVPRFAGNIRRAGQHHAYSAEFLEFVRAQQRAGYGLADIARAHGLGDTVLYKYSIARQNPRGPAPAAAVEQAQPQPQSMQLIAQPTNDRAQAQQPREPHVLDWAARMAKYEFSAPPKGVLPRRRQQRTKVLTPEQLRGARSPLNVPSTINAVRDYQPLAWELRRRAHQYDRKR